MAIQITVFSFVTYCNAPKFCFWTYMSVHSVDAVNESDQGLHCFVIQFVSFGHITLW